MDATRRSLAGGGLERTAIAEEVGGSDQGKPKFPSKITVVGPDGKNQVFRRFHEALPKVKCHQIIMLLGDDLRDPGEDEKNIINLKFNGKAYPADTTLEEIHREVDLNQPGCVTAELTDVAAAKMKLKEITGGNGCWMINDEREICYKSVEYDSPGEAENFIKNFSDGISGMKIDLKISVEKVQYRGRGGTPPPPVYIAHIQIDGSQAKTICDAVAAREIIRVAPVIAQAIRHPDGNALAMLPIDVLCRLGPFLAPRLDEAKAFEVTGKKISEAEEQFWAKEKFLRIEPVHALGVRTSIGATSCLLLDGSAVSREQAERLENIASIDFSSKGMVIKFPDKEYAHRFFHGLKNTGYSSVEVHEKVEQSKFGKYEAAVIIKDLHEVKNFVEFVCGYGTFYTRDLFEVSTDQIKLGKKFFVDELRCIGGLDKVSAVVKKEKAKALLDNFLPHLNSADAAELKKEIAELARPNAENNPGPLQFLREHTGLGSILPGDAYSDEVGTYKTIMAKIDELISKSS